MSIFVNRSFKKQNIGRKLIDRIFYFIKTILYWLKNSILLFIIIKISGIYNIKQK